MFKIRKKDWIAIVLHMAFWAGVFYTMLSLTQPHIKVRFDANGNGKIEDISHPLSPQLLLTLGFLIVLFYSDIFWLLKQALRYKNRSIRVLLPMAWFGVIFVADHYAVALLPAQKKYDTMVMAQPDKSTSPVQQPAAHPGDAKVLMKQRGQIRSDTIQREVVRQESRPFLFATEGFSDTLLFIFIIIFGLSIAWFFLKEWSRVEKMRSELAAVQLDTEVKFLKSQVNPHFLFNTLNNLFSMAQKKGDDSLADGISKLAGMMRYMIYESNEAKVPLAKEIAYLEDCILLNKLRYEDNEAVVQFGYPADTRGVVIAPMLFIPFVENAFKHGIRIGESSEIAIAIAITNNYLTFTCTNTIYRVKKMEQEKGGIGLENVKRRLDLIYPGKYELSTKTDDNRYIVNLGITLA